jgi:triacylglycerol lipase
MPNSSVLTPALKPLPDPEFQHTLLLRPESNPTGHAPFAEADRYPFEPEARRWSRVNAWWLAEASWLAYSASERDVSEVYRDRTGLACRFVSGPDTGAYVASSERVAIVAFTSNPAGRWRELFDDTRFTPLRWEAGHVHKGVGRAFAALRPALEATLDRLEPTCRIWFTGHGLAAGIATLAAYHYRLRAAGIYTFGSPRIGNGVFAGLFGPAFQERSVRYVHDHDIVTHVPPKPFALPHGLFTHVDHLRWINKEGQVGSTQPTVPHFVTDVFGRTNVLLEVLESATTTSPSLPASLADHASLFYALHCWNDFARHLGRPRAGSAL